MTKKLIFLSLSILCFLSFITGCKKSEIDKKMDNELALKYADRALELNLAVKKNYFIDDVQFAYHYYPNTQTLDGNLSTAFLWPYTEMVAATHTISSLSPYYLKQFKNYYENLIQGFEYYHAFRNDYTAYCAVRAAKVFMGGGDTYYDDNVWVAREFLNAYLLLGEEAYLKKALEVSEFIFSGWAKDEIGGIYWFEQKRRSRNTCSNAPTAILFGRLYEVTKDEEWLNRAILIYDFVYNTLRDPKDNCYWDNISNEGSIDYAKFTYNTGSMIEAGVKLYEITNDKKYLDEASLSAMGSYNTFYRETNLGFKAIEGSNSWFNCLLLQSYIALYPYNNKVLDLILNYEKMLNYAYDLSYDSNSGFFNNEFLNEFKKDENNLVVIEKENVLDMAANAEHFGLLAHFYNEKKGS